MIIYYIFKYIYSNIITVPKHNVQVDTYLGKKTAGPISVYELGT